MKLKKKSIKQMRLTQTRGLSKSLRPDELEFIAENINTLSWLEIASKINNNRPNGYGLTHGSILTQAKKKGITKGKNTKPAVRNTKIDTSIYVDYKEFAWYYQ